MVCFKGEDDNCKYANFCVLLIFHRIRYTFSLSSGEHPAFSLIFVDI